MTTTAPTRGQLLFGLVAVVVVGWIVYVVVSIVGRPVAGEPDLGRLAQSTQAALSARNADDLGRLLDRPDGDVDQFAADYVATIGRDVRGPIRVVTGADDVLEVSGQRTDGVTFSYPLKAIRTEGGRWVLTFAPPL